MTFLDGRFDFNRPPEDNTNETKEINQRTIHCESTHISVIITFSMIFVVPTHSQFLEKIR